MKVRLVIYFSLIFTFFSCEKEEKQPPLFQVLEPGETGISFSNDLTETKALNILDYLYFYNGGGVAVGDINNDRLPDIYFTGNQVKNKLYLNNGNMQFEDITETANVSGNSDWNTGVTMADVNGDGLLDIYVCAVVGVNGLRGKNELFINNGDNTFTEAAENFGLDFQNYSSSAAFFDYDNDGDLDMYLLNHAVHTVNTYGPANIRKKRHEESGDKLLRNDDGKFTDVSEEAGIYGGPNSYGLGVATADFNNDGYTDIYVSNDFHEDDYYYINNGDDTFSEKSKEKFGHQSRFSMGSDVADINQDGYMDILSLDMLPEDEKILKASVGDDPLDLNNMKIEKLGYHHQYTRNMMHLNQGGKYFQEIGLLSNLAATDWSWSALFADYDLDGRQDVFISTGIPKRPNDLDYIKYVSNEQISRKMNNSRLVDQKALEMMPGGFVPNYIFKGSDSLNFENKSKNWISQDSIISTGTAYADLNNNGRLDIITNNLNTPAAIYENQGQDGNFLQLSFEYSDTNFFGIGTKAITFQNGKMQYKQLFPAHGFQSSSQMRLHFGFINKTIDSLYIIWPDNTIQKEFKVKTNQSLKITTENNRDTFNYAQLFPRNETWFEKIESLPGIDYVHQENRFNDFDRQKLIPYKISNRGPAVLVADLNGDGKDDIFFGHSKFQDSELYYQKEDTFEKDSLTEVLKNNKTEEAAVLAEDFDNNGKQDLLIASGGGEFFSGNKALQDMIFYNKNAFEVQNLPIKPENTSVAVTADFNKNGYLDIFLGNGAISNDFGAIKDSYLLQNNEGEFQPVENKVFKELGMVTDAVWSDFNDDGQQDLIVVGEWMPPKFFQNKNGFFQDISDKILPKNLNGLWQAVIPFDINKDGKTDYLLGNWGLNTKFKASEKNPLKMFYADFDENGHTETILAYKKDGEYYPINGLDELVGQLSYLRKKFPAYHKFAGKNIEKIFGKKPLENAKVFEVNSLASGYLLNKNGKFIFKQFEAELQVAPITEFLEFDFNNDGNQEVLAGGNYFGLTPYHGRFDAFPGAIITSNGQIKSGGETGLNFTQKEVRAMNLVNFRGQNYLMVNFNDKAPSFYKINSQKR